MSLPSASERLRRLDHSQIHNIRNALSLKVWGWGRYIEDAVPNIVEVIAEVFAEELEFEERMDGT